MNEKHLVNGFGGKSFGSAAMHGGGAGGQPAFGGGGGPKDPWEVSFFSHTCLPFFYFFVVHYSLSPLGNQKLGKNTPLLPFLWRFLYFINQFHYF